MIVALIQLTLALLIGAMVFFPSVVAPRVFKALDEDQAGRFLRVLFPAYYAYIIIVSGICAGLMVAINTNGAITMAVIAISTLWVRQMLVPRINAAKDKAREGDEAAEKSFKRGHRLSVVINLFQMLVILALFIHIAWA